MVGREKWADSKTVAVCHLRGMHFSSGMDGLISSVTAAEVATVLLKDLSLPAFSLKMCLLQSSPTWLTKSIKTVPKIMNGFERRVYNFWSSPNKYLIFSRLRIIFQKWFLAIGIW